MIVNELKLCGYSVLVCVHKFMSSQFIILHRYPTFKHWEVGKKTNTSYACTQLS